MSIRKTADQPEQDTYKRRPLFGNKTSTEPLSSAAAALAQMQRNTRSIEPLKITGAKIEIACLQRALFVGGSRPGRACERPCQLRDVGDQGVH